MAGRNRGPRYAVNNGPRGLRDEPRPMIIPGSRPLHPHSMLLEEELEMRIEDEHRFTSENRHLNEECIHIRRELQLVKEECDRISELIPQVRAERVMGERELIQRGLRLESAVRETEPLKSEVAQLRSESQKLNAQQQELSTKCEGLKKDLARAQIENKQLALMRADAENLQQQILRFRDACEYEKRGRLELMEQKQQMEESLLAQRRELERLQAGGTYGILKASSELGEYSRIGFGDAYPVTWGSYDRQGAPRY